jgi:hypothetical protein
MKFMIPSAFVLAVAVVNDENKTPLGFANDEMKSMVMDLSEADSKVR